jgi:hypothetical protein
MTDAIENLASVLYFFCFFIPPLLLLRIDVSRQKEGVKIFGASNSTPHSKHPLHLATTPFNSPAHIY